MSEVKLNWTMQPIGLVADVRESSERNTKYLIHQDEKGWGARAIRVKDGMTRTDFSPTRQPLDSMIRWCEDDSASPPCPARDDSPFVHDGVYKWHDGSNHSAPPEPEEPEEPEGAMPIGSPVCPLESFDARVWAKEFMRCTSGYAAGTEGYRIMEETVVGWFSNALMRGYDEHRWKMERESKEAPKRPCDMDATEFAALARDQFRLILDAGKPRPKFPVVGDGKEWASRCTAWFGSFKVPDLTEWFDAALQFGFHRGLNDQTKPPETPPRSEYEAEGFKFPPATPGFAYEEAPAVKGALGAEVAFLKKRLSDLERKQAEHDKNRWDEIQELGASAELRDKRLDEIGTTASKAASRVGQLWQKQTLELREANKRIGKLEEKLPRTGDPSLGTQHEEVCARLSKLEKNTEWSADSRVVGERLQELDKKLMKFENTAKSYAYDLGWKTEMVAEDLRELKYEVEKDKKDRDADRPRT